MIIEFTGIPGSGKSTILATLKKEVTNKKFIFDIKKYLLGFQGNTFLFDFYLLINIYRIEKEDIGLLKIIFKIVSKSKNPFFHKINILRNSYKKIVINALIKNKDEVFFIDEGLYHIPFTLFVDEDEILDKNEVVSLIHRLPQQNLLLIVDATDEILFKRVLHRGKNGHRRINFDSTDDTVAFMKQSREVLEMIKMTVKHELYINTQEIIETKEILKMLGINNV